MFAIKECFNQPSLFFKHSPWVRNGDHLAKRGHRFKANQTCIFIVKMHTQIKHNLPHLTSHAHHPHEFIGSYCMQKNPPYNPQPPIPPRHPHPLDQPLLLNSKSKNFILHPTLPGTLRGVSNQKIKNTCLLKFIFRWGLIYENLPNSQQKNILPSLVSHNCGHRPKIKNPLRHGGLACQMLSKIV